MKITEMENAYYKALKNRDIHEARYYSNLIDAFIFDAQLRKYNPSEFGGWNHKKEVKNESES